MRLRTEIQGTTAPLPLAVPRALLSSVAAKDVHYYHQGSVLRTTYVGQNMDRKGQLIRRFNPLAAPFAWPAP